MTVFINEVDGWGIFGHPTNWLTTRKPLKISLFKKEGIADTLSEQYLHMSLIIYTPKFNILCFLTISGPNLVCEWLFEWMNAATVNRPKHQRAHKQTVSGGILHKITPFSKASLWSEMWAVLKRNRTKLCKFLVKPSGRYRRKQLTLKMSEMGGVLS